VLTVDSNYLLQLYSYHICDFQYSASRTIVDMFDGTSKAKANISLGGRREKKDTRSILEQSRIQVVFGSYFLISPWFLMSALLIPVC
jgi:hypothetical protein